jgi:hypothetical protein
VDGVVEREGARALGHLSGSYSTIFVDDGELGAQILSDAHHLAAGQQVTVVCLTERRRCEIGQVVEDEFVKWPWTQGVVVGCGRIVVAVLVMLSRKRPNT